MNGGDLAGINSIFGGDRCRDLSLDLRMRVLREVEAGASRREAARCVEVSASSAIKWMQRLNEQEALRSSQRRQHLAAGGARGLCWG